ncbi:hypothetical protein N7510_009126 [Penicillium lagena]|uniref:uncharacterized protein n=1 Tax=Penicillium lagena TaxID=94218 RepID=UPI0025423E31|nr:uncharacterized protein N7510_009126 [Penicillium lagena]KAJ5606345.1 hypothetical protein N7510_009126 [Penicillium lagena]
MSNPVPDLSMLHPTWFLGDRLHQFASARACDDAGHAAWDEECGILVRDTLLACQCTALVFRLSASAGHQVQHRISGNVADWNEPPPRQTKDAETGAEGRDYSNT